MSYDERDAMGESCQQIQGLACSAHARSRHANSGWRTTFTPSSQQVCQFARPQLRAVKNSQDANAILSDPGRPRCTACGERSARASLRCALDARPLETATATATALAWRCARPLQSRRAGRSLVDVRNAAHAGPCFDERPRAAGAGPGTSIDTFRPRYAANSAPLACRG